MTVRTERTSDDLSSSPLERLRSQLSGTLIDPASPDYDMARQAHNALIDERPYAIVRAADAADVLRAVGFARENYLPLAVKSGGHGFAGYSVAEGSVVVDLSAMKRIRIDPASRVARVQAGVTSGELAPAAQEHGLVLSTGDVSSVGIGGLTLGGGIGYLVRKNGLTIDHLLSAEVVTSDGRLLTASSDQNSDLFWALRGGGGNFGIVTEFEFQLQPALDVIGGMVVFPARRDIVRAYLDIATAAPEGLTTIASLMTAPPAPFIPDDIVGKPVFAVIACFSGDAAEGERAVAPLRTLGEPICDLIEPIAYPQIYDFTEEATMRIPLTLRSMFTNEIPDATIDALIAHMDLGTATMNMMQIRVLGGAMARVPADATAFAHRDKRFMLSVVAEWEDPSTTAQHQEWTNNAWDDVRAIGDGAYVNFLEDEGDDRIREAYPAATMTRLAEVKATYDPSNIFRLNQNIQPAS